MPNTDGICYVFVKGLVNPIKQQRETLELIYRYDAWRYQETTSCGFSKHRNEGGEGFIYVPYKFNANTHNGGQRYFICY